MLIEITAYINRCKVLMVVGISRVTAFLIRSGKCSDIFLTIINDNSDYERAFINFAKNQAKYYSCLEILGFFPQPIKTVLKLIKDASTN